MIQNKFSQSSEALSASLAKRIAAAASSSDHASSNKLGQQQTTTTTTPPTTKLMDSQQMHICRLCDKLLSSSSSLDRHMLTHSGERPFVCKRCHMTFTTNGNMHRHMRTHLHKDSLARQQQEQQLKSLIGASVISATSTAPASFGDNNTSNLIAANQQHQHPNHLLASHRAFNPLMADSLVAATVGPQGSSVSALLNQQLVAALNQQQQQQQQSVRTTRRSYLHSGEQKVALDHQTGANISPATVSNSAAAPTISTAAQMAHEGQAAAAAQAAAEAAIKFFRQHQLDPKAFMAGALHQQQHNQHPLGLESVKAVMLAAAAAAAAAAVSQQQQHQFSGNKSTGETDGSVSALNVNQGAADQEEAELSELSGSSPQRLRGKRRKQVNPSRSTRLQNQLAATIMAPTSLNGHEEEDDDDDDEYYEGEQTTNISSSNTGILIGRSDEDDEDLDEEQENEDDEVEHEFKRRLHTSIASYGQQQKERIVASSPIKREFGAEDFNNNGETHKEANTSATYNHSTEKTAKPDHTNLTEDDDEGLRGENDDEEDPVKACDTIQRVTNEDSNATSSSLRGRRRKLNSTSEDEDDTMMGGNEEDDEMDEDDDDDDRMDAMSTSIEINLTNSSDNNSRLQLFQNNNSNNNNSNPSESRQQHKRLTIESPSYNNIDNDNNQTQVNNQTSLLSQQHQRQQEHLQSLPNPLITINGEIIEDISQSYVKTANPNAARKGGKRNRHCYKCKLCTYSSVDRCTLVRHLRIHSGERPYICGICRYAFTTKANCERHVRKRHKKQYNSLGGSGGVKGSNGGGRSLIITDHSNHQTIPVKVNPVAAQTISQTLQRIQEKTQASNNLQAQALDLSCKFHQASK